MTWCGVPHPIQGALRGYHLLDDALFGTVLAQAIIGCDIVCMDRRFHTARAARRQCMTQVESAPT